MKVKASGRPGTRIRLAEYDVQIRVEGEGTATVAIAPAEVKHDADFDLILDSSPPKNGRLLLEVRRRSQSELLFKPPSCVVGGIVAAPAPPRFPWPPPKASATTRMQLSECTGQERTNLGAVAGDLVHALEKRGYRRSFHSVPGGFALITQMERLEQDGTPAREPARWSAEIPAIDELSLAQFLKSLIRAPTGRYRILVFIVTDQSVPGNGPVTTAGALGGDMFGRGKVEPPQYLVNIACGPEHVATALVYEFAKSSNNDTSAFVTDSRLSAAEHLRRSGIIDFLRLIRL